MANKRVDTDSERCLRRNLLHTLVEQLPGRVTTAIWRSPHFWIIVLIILLETFIYYVDQSPWATFSLFDNTFFSGVHDLHRLLYLVPIVYAALVFRVRGSLISSLILLCVVLPRGLLFSPYPDPMLRALIFVVAAALVGLLVAIQLNRIEREEEARIQLDTAYKQLKESQEQLIHAEKLNSLGQLAASIAHEVNNPLSGVLVYVQLLAKKLNSSSLPREKTLEYLKTMELELTRCGQLTRNLLDFSRQTQPTFELVDINEVIDRAFNLVAHMALLHCVQVNKEFSPCISRVMADPNQIQQVITNLMLNTIQAMPQGGTMTLRTANSR